MGAWEDGYRTGYNDAINQSRNFTPEQFRLRPIRETTRETPRKKRKGTPLKGMAAALKKANAMARKKDGSFKKGWSQAKVMSKAHKLRRRK